MVIYKSFLYKIKKTQHLLYSDHIKRHEITNITLSN